tara:strand:- start:1734 stop:2960 length:1227 start_codon:yes stop_codon:yes gene_type:complete
VEQFSSKPWYPKAAIRDISENEPFGNLKHYNLHTKFGTLDMFHVPKLNEIKIFRQLITDLKNLEEFEFWGEFKDLGTIENIEISELKNGIKINLITSNKTLEGIFHNFPIKSWRRKWSELKDEGYFLIPTGGVQWNGHDLMVFRESVDFEQIQWKTESSFYFSEIGAVLGKFHSRMLDYSAPRMEKEWNSRLKRLETITSSGTLWRVPYSKNTNSIRSLGNLKLSNWIIVNEKIKLDLLLLGYQKFGNLITDNNRFSCLRDIASIYVEIDNSKISNSSNSKDFLRKIFFESWRNEAPEKWYSKSALDGNLGGMQIWRYDVELYNLFQSKLFNQKYDRTWIRNVKDIQRSLFNYRIISATSLGMLVSSTTIAILWPNLSLSIKLIIFSSGIFLYSSGMKFYRNTSLPPY